MKVFLFVTMIIAGQQPQQRAIEVPSVEACLEALQEVLQPDHAPPGINFQAGCALVAPVEDKS